MRGPPTGATDSAMFALQPPEITESFCGTPPALRAAMPSPRQILPGSTYLVTRRTLRRHFLLRPDPELRAIVVYMLAVSGRRHGIVVHGFCVLSTHIHLVVSDPQGELPRFLEYFHRLLALATKVLRRWEGAVWDHEQTSLVRLETSEAIVDKLGYVLANPVTAGLVRYARDWPGAKSHPDDLGGGRMRAARPRVYLSQEGRKRWPAFADLELGLPSDVEPDAAEVWRAAVKRSVAAHESRARTELARQGRRFSGADRATSVSPYDRATSDEPTRKRNPTFAVSSVPGAFSAAVVALRAFRAAYRVALTRWRAGFRDVVFPIGTWWMRKAHSAIVAT